jgi:hypothetical protein
MPTVFINSLAVMLPSRFAAGDIIDEVAAAVLNDVQLKRIKARLRWALSRGDVNPDGLQARALELSKAELVPYATMDDDDEGETLDPVFVEALAMARELITSQMAKEGLPPPKGLDLHAKALVDANPALQERARLRIEARYRAANAAIEGAV